MSLLSLIIGPAGDNGGWVESVVLEGHTGSVNCADVLVIGGDRPRALIATASTDGTARIYMHATPAAAPIGEGGDNNNWTLLDRVVFGPGIAPGQLPISVSLQLMPGQDVPILAVGGDDAKIRLFCFVASGGGGEGASAASFKLMTTLTGHEDWVRSVAFARGSTGSDLLLASASQDSYVRLWRISPSADGILPPGQTLSFTERALRQSRFLFALPEGSGSSGSGTSSGAEESHWEAKLDALLTGHDGWVYSVRWQPCKPTEPQPLVLLSASMDRTMIVWSPDSASGVWMDTARVGEVGGTYIQGFFGGLFAPHGKRIVAHGFHGAFYCWDAVDEESSGGGGGGGAAAATVDGTASSAAPASGMAPTRWVAKPGPTGHFSEARDLAWEPTGSYLVTVSDDQTARLFMPCKAIGEQPESWHEVARPQVHGYDMRCAVFTASHVLVTGSDEKVIRVFEAPGNFFDAAAKLCNVGSETLSRIATAGAAVPAGASIPALGLSNKAIFDHPAAAEVAVESNPAAEPMPAKIPEGGGGGAGGGDGHLGGVDGNTRTAMQTNAVVLPFEQQEVIAAPTEAHLVQNTLWPETQKLFGHGFELITLAANHAGTLVVSACKATNEEHAVLRVWSTTTWQEVYTLAGHKLTVTRAAFSPSDEWLVSGSRDRQICIYKRSDPQASGGGADSAPATSGAPHYALVQTIAKAHDRIIWDLCWSPDGAYFATGSRDKTVAVWGPTAADAAGPGAYWTPKHKTKKLGDSVTALDFAPATCDGGGYVLAVGFELGTVTLFNVAADDEGTLNAAPVHTVDKSLCPPATIKRLRWRPGQTMTAAAGDEAPWSGELALCAVDSSVRILSIVF